MPSLEHQLVLEIIRNSPQLAVDLLNRVLPSKLPPHASIALVPPNAEQFVPAELRADAILELRDPEGTPVAEIIVEIQASIDADKPFIWPAYLINRRAKHRRKVVLAIIALDKTVARWAQTPIHLDFEQGVLTLPVIGPGVIPKVRDPAQAEENPPLAVLSALTHAKDQESGTEIALNAFFCLVRLPEEQIDTELIQAYIHAIWRALGPLAQKILELKLMEAGSLKNLAHSPPFQRLAEYYRAEFEPELIAKGRAEGKAEGKAEGEARATVLTLRSTLLDALELRKISLSSDQRKSIESCEDPALLKRWVHNAFTASTAEELFAE